MIVPSLADQINQVHSELYLLTISFPIYNSKELMVQLQNMWRKLSDQNVSPELEKKSHYMIYKHKN